MRTSSQLGVVSLTHSVDVGQQYCRIHFLFCVAWLTLFSDCLPAQEWKDFMVKHRSGSPEGAQGSGQQQPCRAQSESPSLAAAAAGLAEVSDVSRPARRLVMEHTGAPPVSTKPSAPPQPARPAPNAAPASAAAQGQAPAGQQKQPPNKGQPAAVHTRRKAAATAATQQSAGSKRRKQVLPKRAAEGDANAYGQAHPAKKQKQAGPGLQGPALAGAVTLPTSMPAPLPAPAAAVPTQVQSAAPAHVSQAMPTAQSGKAPRSQGTKLAALTASVLGAASRGQRQAEGREANGSLNQSCTSLGQSGPPTAAAQFQALAPCAVRAGQTAAAGLGGTTSDASSRQHMGEVGSIRPPGAQAVEVLVPVKEEFPAGREEEDVAAGASGAQAAISCPASQQVAAGQPASGTLPPPLDSPAAGPLQPVLAAAGPPVAPAAAPAAPPPAPAVQADLPDALGLIHDQPGNSLKCLALSVPARPPPTSRIEPELEPRAAGQECSLNLNT